MRSVRSTDLQYCFLLWRCVEACNFGCRVNLRKSKNGETRPRELNATSGVTVLSTGC